MPQAQRPPLPIRHANQHIKGILTSGTLPPVKYQVLNCQGSDILVGRLKIDTPTPTGHAFILRRFDTNAISLTTMFRAAFPNASDQEEKEEVQWVKDSYDLSGNNGSSKDTSITRLAGTWVSPGVAMELGKSYLLGDLITAVVQAQPDPSVNYRRSGKGQMTPKVATTTVVTTEVVETVSSSKASNTAAASPEQKPSKRRREASPLPETSPPKIKASASVEEKPLPRRSTRTRSPPPKVAPSTSMMAVVNKATSSSPTKTPSKRSSRRAVKQEEVPAPVTPGGSEETAFEEREDETQAADDIAGSQLHEQDVAEQKGLIADLKRRRDEALASRDEDAEMDETDAAKNKRVREDEDQKLRFNFKEPEVRERAIATNRRVLGQLLEEPRRRSLAWGVAAFVFGAGAATLLPSFL